MKKVIIDRCCGNCEWGISPECEKEIMEENGYDENDLTRPRAGDCCLGIDHEGNCVCNEHQYLSGGLETYVFYDDKDIAPGYYVVNTYCDYVISCFKFYRIKEKNGYSYGFVAHDLYPVKKGLYNKISFEIEKDSNPQLFFVIKSFANGLDGYALYDSDNVSDIHTCLDENSVNLFFYKAYNDRDNKFINVKIRYNPNDRDYKLVATLFRNMAVVTSNKKNDYIYKRVRKVIKK